MGFWIDVKKTIEAADVILYVLDARMPEISNNQDLERILIESGKKVFLILNKIDLVSLKRKKDLEKR